MSEKTFLEQYLDNIAAQYDSSRFKPFIEAGTEEYTKVACRDGVELTTVIYKPVSKGPYPTIVVRCPYATQDVLWRAHGQHLTKRGYALVLQWCRGTAGSGGKWEPNVNERSDGQDLLAWLEQQSWVDCMGMWGTSYLGLTGWVLADYESPKFRSICANHYGTERFTSAYCKGSFRSDVLTSWARGNAGHPVDTDYLEAARYRPQMEVDEAMWGGKLDWYRDWISHPRSDDPYWGEGFWGLLKEIPVRAKVPMFIHEGWFDHHLGSALVSWGKLNPAVREHSWLRIGCWNHFFMNPLEGINPPNLAAEEVPESLEWFDLTLKRKEQPESKVEYYEIGSDSWHAVSAWPPVSNAADVETESERAQSVRLLLDAHTTDGDSVVYGLVAESSSADNGNSTDDETIADWLAAASVSYDYDPDNPVPSLGGEALLQSRSEIGARVQPEPGFRPDVVTFESKPLEQDLHVRGAITVELYVSSSAPDTAFTAKLMEVGSDGVARNYRTSITTLALDEPNAPEYKPGEVRRVSLTMWDISWMIPAGSRIRCDIASSDFPQYAIHTNTAGLWSEQTDAVVAHQTIHTGAGCPSAIVLPIA